MEYPHQSDGTEDDPGGRGETFPGLPGGLVPGGRIVAESRRYRHRRRFSGPAAKVGPAAPAAERFIEPTAKKTAFLHFVMAPFGLWPQVAVRQVHLTAPGPRGGERDFRG